MLDTTSYTDKLPESLNSVLARFTGGSCIMVRKAKDGDKLKGRKGNCHLNVQDCIDKHGGSTVSGWLLNRDPIRAERGMYVWSFHSVWQKPDGKLLDVTEDKHYAGRDKSIFVPDSNRKPDMEKGIAHNNFVVFTEPNFATYYGNSIGKSLEANNVYWCNNTMLQLLHEDEHSGEYFLLVNYPENQKNMGNQYGIDLIDGKLVTRSDSPYKDAVPVQIFFDYNLKSK